MKIPNQTFHIDSSICTDFPFYAFCISFFILHFFAVFFPSTDTDMYTAIRQWSDTQTLTHFYSIAVYKGTNSFLSFCFALPLNFYFRKMCFFHRCMCGCVCARAFMFTPIHVLTHDYVLKKHFLALFLFFSTLLFTTYKIRIQFYS